MSIIINDILDFKGLDKYFYSKEKKCIYIKPNKDDDYNVKTVYSKKSQENYDILEVNDMMDSYVEITRDECVEIFKKMASKKTIQELTLSDLVNIMMKEKSELKVVISSNVMKKYKNEEKELIFNAFKKMSLKDLDNELSLIKVSGFYECPKTYLNLEELGLYFNKAIKYYESEIGLCKTIVLLKHKVLTSKDRNLNINLGLNFDDFFRDLGAGFSRKEFLDIVPNVLNMINMRVKEKEALMHYLERDKELKETVLSNIPSLKRYEIVNKEVIKDGLNLQASYFELDQEALKSKFSNVSITNSEVLKNISGILKDYQIKNKDLDLKIVKNRCYIINLLNDDMLDDKVKRIKDVVNLYMDFLSEKISKEESYNNNEFFKFLKTYDVAISIDKTIDLNNKLRKRKL